MIQFPTEFLRIKDWQNRRCPQAAARCVARCITKVELPQESILFRTQFPSLEIFIGKKVGNQKKLRPLLLYQF